MAHLISINIERSKHLDRVIAFITARAPDVVCLQELSADDIPALCAATRLAHAHYVPMAVHPLDGKTFGVGILARRPFASTGLLPYAGVGDGTLAFDRTTPESRLDSCRYAAALADIEIGGLRLSLATTHFPWTPDGGSRPFQVTAAARLVAGLGDRPLVLTGDFNAPRGGEIFATLARRWTDCIPPQVTTSLDPLLHRAGPLELMVDGLFLSPHYRARDVTLSQGVSDHQAISATILAA